MGAQFTIPLVTVIPGQLIASAIWNNELTNIGTNFIPAGMDSYSDTDAQMQIQTDPYPGNVTSHAANLGGEFERIRFQMAAMLGATTPPFWYADPPSNLTALNNISIPIGGSIRFPSATPPNSNWLLRNGQAISRSVYSVLFALIGTTFGVGDGSTTFNIPNDIDKMPIGAGNLYALGATGGATTHTLTKTEIPIGLHTLNDPGHGHTITDPAHSHSVTDPTHSHVETGRAVGSNNGSGLTGAATGSVFTASHSANASSTGLTVNSVSTGITGANSNTTGASLTDNAGGGSHSILNPYLAEYWIMRVL